MQTAFGAVAWDYTGSMLFGVIPDPVACAVRGPHLDDVHAGIWGILGLVLDQAAACRACSRSST